ncbi:hypothetical protein CPAST_c40310 [Clostridium pasteurianum DSM 525 = ATCC 6013]|uniref:Uncharacterized protein n=1 Tax=Clostridium pasteurianum DSM 525 = ATCC 6013 TaxID=1262449 RepID=A0A0H3JBN9_CLOPA|nr:hypothetical protein [Clostridium pasteurianum]AJA50060.1 hypothetical protein CPAST_c40310 [Clostridium pasteurianum DSM 525 = ATCC 6013]AJA54048.1 hypothetical protein CLPA_c40310 [Clostridium pasteurianum DSM 525 = ATCC 6013]AOZ77186.1 hypothetical protein AQ983_19600 [Clostridium pasteurianum DSM 525 = ATCC 6013]AOZ80983.1 hypothetical protein AQ984_19595 [Clostridium pasteurianum]ELP59235.1 hypothetical protein F502_10153 [Clostridium pasteurianum DSM 525 = ATCC 6013]
MKGKLPFPKWILNTELKIFDIEIGEDGGPNETIMFEGKAFYEEKTRQTLDKDRSLVTLSGKVIVPGDINPGKIIKGCVQIGEVKKDIFKSSRPKNPDGTVFSTELDLM